MSVNPLKIKQDFPIFQAHPSLVYLDSAATSLKPKPVIDAEVEYYTKYGVNIHRGIYKLSTQASSAYDTARETVQEFIHAKFPHEIIFTSGATAGINIVAQGFAKQLLHQGDEIIVTILEHHANIVPWQMIAKKFGYKLTFWDITDDGVLNENEFNKLLNPHVKFLAITHVSNAIGTINPLKKIIQKAHAAKIKVLVDDAQGVPHLPINVEYLDCDFLVFSGHKMLAPTGTGVLYVKDRILQQMEPFFYGGDMIREVHKEYSVWNDPPEKFETGTPNIAGVIGLKRAIEYLQEIGLANIREHEKKLLNFAISELQKLSFVKLFGPLDSEKQSGVLSLTMDDIHPHDIAAFLDADNIAIRAGHHCAMPLMERLNVPATTRVSFYLYNTEEDIEKLVSSLKKIHKIFNYVPNGRRPLHQPHPRPLQKSERSEELYP